MSEELEHDLREAAMRRIARRRKITIAAVIVLFPLLSAVSLYWSYKILTRQFEADPSGPVTGRLRIDAGLRGESFDLPNHVIRLNRAEAGIQVVEKESQRIVLESAPGKCFLRFSDGFESMGESRGLFRLKEYRLSDYQEQSLDSISPCTEFEETCLVLHGEVSEPLYDDEGLGFECHISEMEDGSINVWASIIDDDSDLLSPGVQILLGARPEEHFLGFGEQFNHIDLKGQRVPILVSEQGIGRGLQPLTFFVDLFAGAAGDWSTTYAPLPIAYSGDLRRFEFQATPYGECDLRAPGLAGFRTLGWESFLHVDVASSPSELLKRSVERDGGMPPLPDWIISGAIVGMQGGTARVREEFAKLKALETPMAAFWLQDWCGQRKTGFGKQLWWNWELDRERYPEWEAMREELAAEEVRIMTYVNPFLVDIEGKTKQTRNLFREARDLGYLATDEGGKPYLIPNTDFSAGIVDLRREEVRDWMAEVLREQVIGVGASGWMADFGESLPWDVLGEEELDTDWDGVPMHNEYPALWAETNAMACADDEELVYFMRSASAGSVWQTRLFWTGDQLVSWDEFDGMKTSVTALMSSGLSGMVFNHSDIGGYTTVSSFIKDYHRSKELLMRWMELNAFTVVFRTHEGNDPDKNAQFYTDDETMGQFARMAKVYAAWFPYRKVLVQEGSELGLPVVRHPWIHYWEDPEVLKIVYQQFMVGSDFMVAPVLDPGVSRVKVYLPAGRWAHVWTDAVYGGDTGAYVEADAPMGYPAVFYKEGSAAGIAFRDALDAKGLRAGYPAK